jgi:hypothetical protein
VSYRSFLIWLRLAQSAVPSSEKAQSGSLDRKRNHHPNFHRPVNLPKGRRCLFDRGHDYRLVR